MTDDVDWLTREVQRLTGKVEQMRWRLKAAESEAGALATANSELRSELLAARQGRT
jgi:outer membrane murein-binding lipoprotein Lpp